MAPEAPPKPVILAVVDDDDAGAILPELERAYGDKCRVARCAPADALDRLRTFERGGTPVALLVADQRLAGTTGIELIRRAKAQAPELKTVLLAARADTEAAIDAITTIKLDQYVEREHLDTRLNPVVSRLLAEWQQAYEPPPRVEVIAHRFSEASHAVRDFLARNHVRYEWYDAEQDPRAAHAFVRVQPATQLPILLFEDGTWLEDPEPRELAEKLGLRTRATLPFYDVIVVGGGPAGLAAAVYGASEGLRTVVVERDAPGGQAGQSSMIANYLGFPEGLPGLELAKNALEQAERFGAELLSAQEAVELEANGPAKVVHLRDGSALSAYAVIVAGGVSYRRLEAPGVAELTGKGIYYGAALTEAKNCSRQEVYVVGGANSAGQAAVEFAKHARRVTILVRADSLAKSMSHYLIEQIAGIPNIEVRTGAEVVAAGGETQLEKLTIRDEEGTETVRASALFIFIGAQPLTEWLAGTVARDDRGFVLAGPDVKAWSANGNRPRWPLERDPYLLETTAPGVFVAGDVRQGSIKRVASAVGEGSMAVQFVHQYLASGGSSAA
jgi:thioredoxin reductase (NADPH)